jgi:hypothetical protein
MFTPLRQQSIFFGRAGIRALRQVQAELRVPSVILILGRGGCGGWSQALRTRQLIMQGGRPIPLFRSFVNCVSWMLCISCSERLALSDKPCGRRWHPRCNKRPTSCLPFLTFMGFKRKTFRDLSLWSLYLIDSAVAGRGASCSMDLVRPVDTTKTRAPTAWILLSPRSQPLGDLVHCRLVHLRLRHR